MANLSVHLDLPSHCGQNSEMGCLSTRDTLKSALSHCVGTGHKGLYFSQKEVLAGIVEWNSTAYSWSWFWTRIFLFLKGSISGTGGFNHIEEGTARPHNRKPQWLTPECQAHFLPSLLLTIPCTMMVWIWVNLDWSGSSRRGHSDHPTNRVPNPLICPQISLSFGDWVMYDIPPKYRTICVQ